MSRATINDVAREAQVSKKTVSRVLNQEPNVHLDTRQRVLDAMEMLNYRPSKQARGLASTQSYLVALIYDNPNKSYISDVQEGCLTSCNALGYHLLIHPYDFDSEQRNDDIREMIVDTQVDGIILTPPFSDNREILKLIEQLDKPCIRIGGTIDDNHSSYITANDLTISKKLTKYLISLGHRRIGFIKGHPDHPASQLRLKGYSNALAESGMELDESLICEGKFAFANAEIAARSMLQLEQPPTAIFASNDQMAAAILKVASQSGLVVPHELSVCGFDDAPISNYIWPSLTTVRAPVQEISSQACRTLIQQIKQRQPVANVVHECELIIRASTAPPTKPSQ